MKPTLYKTTLDFGKVDAEMRGEKRNRVTVEIELRGTPLPGGREFTSYGKLPEDLELSICGNIWNSRGSDIISGGQNYDTLLEDAPSPLMHEIVGVWKRWHLNGMNAGCEHQRDWPTSTENKTAGWVRPEEHPDGLLGKPCDVCGYKYGTAWKHETLPREIVNQVMGWEKRLGKVAK